MKNTIKLCSFETIFIALFSLGISACSKTMVVKTVQSDAVNLQGDMSGKITSVEVDSVDDIDTEIGDGDVFNDDGDTYCKVDESDIPPIGEEETVAETMAMGQNGHELVAHCFYPPGNKFDKHFTLWTPLHAAEVHLRISPRSYLGACSEDPDASYETCQELPSDEPSNEEELSSEGR